MDIWSVISPCFDRSEKWGNANLMSGLMLMTLFHVREHVGLPFIIHCGYASTGHSDTSQHYHGNAVDFHVDCIDFKSAIKMMETAITDLRIENRVGLGIYADWVNKGFHLDCRGTKARWGRIQGTYVSYDEVLNTL